MIPKYPESTEITMELRPELHPHFQKLSEGIAEFSFANIYLFRELHNYRISRFEEEDDICITGRDNQNPFFMLPFGLPGKDVLEILFHDHSSMKAASGEQAKKLENMGYTVMEDRDNFDYLYLREDLANLTGRKFHKKRNLIKAFLNNYEYQGEPLLDEYIPAALDILETWRKGRDNPGDYYAAKEALEKSWDLQLCGGIYYVDGKPVAYSLGEEIAYGEVFVIHFEKAVIDYKGLYQFINQSFSAILPEKYKMINREQDLGNPGLRKAKESYHPCGFVKKYRVNK